MSTQPDLKFGGLSIAKPANTYDWYEPASQKHGLSDFSESAIPGTKGRRKIILGGGNQESSSQRLVFEGEVYFATTAAMEQWLTAIEAAAMSAGQNLRTVYYGYMNDGGTFQRDNCDILVEPGKVDRLGNGWFWREFRATFNQW